MLNRVDYSWLSDEHIMGSRKFWLEMAERRRRRFLDCLMAIRSYKGEGLKNVRLLDTRTALRSLVGEAESLREVRRINGELRRRARALRFK